jgi:hypothetical protein
MRDPPAARRTAGQRRRELALARRLRRDVPEVRCRPARLLRTASEHRRAAPHALAKGDQRAQFRSVSVAIAMRETELSPGSHRGACCGRAGAARRGRRHTPAYLSGSSSRCRPRSRFRGSSKAVTHRRRSGVIVCARLQYLGAPQRGPAKFPRRPIPMTLLFRAIRDTTAGVSDRQQPGAIRTLKLAVSTRGSVRRRCPDVCSRRSRRPRSVPAPARRTCRAFG